MFTRSFPLLSALCLLTIAAATPSAQAQPRPNWPQSDASGSRNGAIYARRYEVVTRFVSRGDVRLSDRDLAEQAMLALQRAGANRAAITFVDPNVDDSRRSMRDSRESGDYDRSIEGTPRRGNFVPATDRLELTVTVEYRQAPKQIGAGAAGGRVKYSQLEEAVKVGVSGRVLSIDKGTLAYALQPVWLEKQATRDRRIETDKRVTLFGVPILPPVARAGASESSTTRQLALLQTAFDEVADQLVNQLERSPQIGLQNQHAPGSPDANARPSNFWIESRGADGRTVYLTGRDTQFLRQNDELLLPVISRRNANERVVLKGRVTRTGEPCEITVNDNLRDWDFDRQRPIRVLER